MLKAQHEEMVGMILCVFQEIRRCPGPEPGQELLSRLCCCILAHEGMKLVARKGDLIAILILSGDLNSVQEGSALQLAQIALPIGSLILDADAAYCLLRH